MSFFGRGLNLITGAVRGALQSSDLREISSAELASIERELEQTPQSQRPIDPAVIRAELKRRKADQSGTSEVSGDSLSANDDSDGASIKPLKRTL